MLVTSADSPEIAAELARFITDRTGARPFHPGSFAAMGWVDENLVLKASVAAHELCGRDLHISIALDGHRFPRELLRACFVYSFEQLSRRRLTFLIEPANLASITLVKALGAVHEATLRDAGFSGDMHLYALFPENCTIWQRMKCREHGWRIGAERARLRAVDPAAGAVESSSVPDDAGGDAADVEHALWFDVLGLRSRDVQSRLVPD